MHTGATRHENGKTAHDRFTTRAVWSRPVRGDAHHVPTQAGVAAPFGVSGAWDCRSTRWVALRTPSRDKNCTVESRSWKGTADTCKARLRPGDQ